MRVDRSSSNKEYLINAPLPDHGESYTVISHEDVINTTQNLIRNSNFRIVSENYRCSTNAQAASGIYFIEHVTEDPDLKDTDLGLMFAWTNSYDKRIRFQCSLGAYVFACHNGMICGELNYARKHTGNANNEYSTQIHSQLNNAKRVFKKVIDDKDALKNMKLSHEKQAEIAAKMFFTENLLSPHQISCVRDEMNKPSYNYESDQETAWSFYNHVTHAYKTIHPRDWMKNSKKFHDFIMTEINNINGVTNVDAQFFHNMHKAQLAEDVFEIEDSYINFI
jgi:hypothetical protein